MKVTNLMRKALPLKKCGAVIVAAGTASRMGGIDKVMAQLNGEPMIARTVRVFDVHDHHRLRGSTDDGGRADFQG